MTHRRVDRHAGLPDGTTSFYYQTRSALLRGAIDRVIELDVADFTDALDASGDGEVDSLLSQLAEQGCVPLSSLSGHEREHASNS
jgi:DNA-binding transcriptional regulator YbjK